MKTSRIERFWFPLLVAIALVVLATQVRAQQVSREQDIVNLRLGQRVKVDDGTCPAGQIKEVTGTKMNSAGILHARKCVPRLGPKRKN
jgi:hypothetical protein